MPLAQADFSTITQMIASTSVSLVRSAIQSARSRVIRLASGPSGPGPFAISAFFTACPRLPATSGPWSERTASPTIGMTIHDVLHVQYWLVMYAPVA